MEGVNRRNRLKEQVFTYKASKDHKVFIFWQGRQVRILSGNESDKFLSAIGNAGPKEAQLIMAKATGNFKRGNERR